MKRWYTFMHGVMANQKETVRNLPNPVVWIESQVLEQHIEGVSFKSFKICPVQDDIAKINNKGCNMAAVSQMS